MSSDLFLVVHKVRGEAAFDVAAQMTCPICEGQCGEDYISCHECDSLGYWWIIPTSGHRAYPVETWPLSDLIDLNMPRPSLDAVPDHYVHKVAPTVSLVEALGLHRPAKPLPPIQRRF